MNSSISINPVKSIVKKATVQDQIVKVNSRVFGNNSGSWQAKYAETLNFYTFYHPRFSYFIERLNRGSANLPDGMELLQKADTSQQIDDYLNPGAVPTDDDGNTFKNVYKPGTTPDGISLIPEPASFKDSSYYKENIDFCADGAYTKYNYELFFHAPLLIATRLSRNGKYEEAMKWFHYVFNPVTNVPDDGTNKRYWEFLPFQTTKAEKLEDIIKNLPPKPGQDPAILKWLSDPFNPFAVARVRISSFMKNVVMKYLDNLMAWGDDLYRMNTRESINEATQLYVFAAHILGPEPQKIPNRGNVANQTYNSLKGALNAFGDAFADLQNIIPYSSDITVSSSGAAPSGSLLGMGRTLYFCIPANNDLLQYWATVRDRLFNIRHCKNIEGVDQVLSLFAPKIDPALLVKARAQGLSISSILADLNTPSSFYRFNYLLQKANEYCSEVKALGSALLAALEKKDAEELARLRATQESGLLDIITAVKERQVLEAKAARESLLKIRETAQKRMQYYVDLLGITGLPPVPPIPEIAVDLTSESALPPDSDVKEPSVQLNTSLLPADETGVKLIPREKEEFDSLQIAFQYQEAAAALETTASIFHVLPQLSVDGKFLGIGAGSDWGFPFLANAMSAIAKGLQIGALISNNDASKAAKFASYTRREQEWEQQAKMAAREIVQTDKQITSADLRIQIAEKELLNHKQQLANAQKVEQTLQDKFTNTELYAWMKDQLYNTYKQTYQLAYDMAKKAEKSYQFELGKADSSFIQYGYWDSSYQGLSAGDKLQLALRQMEKSFIEENRREFELIKHISLVQLNPLALIQLKETGACNVDLPEEIFDLDYPSHYFRRIKSVSISIPCVAGPYITINSTLRLMRNSIRINTNPGNQNQYEHNNDDGFLTDDDRFVENNIPFKAIATSSAQNDSGVFELNFRDERYLPFEGAGAISDWKLELNGKYTDDKGQLTDLSQFNYDKISDVIIHIKYTAREDAGAFKSSAITHLQKFINSQADNGGEPFMRLFSIRHEFANEWFNFLTKTDISGNQVLYVNLDSKRFPFFTINKNIQISKVMLFAKSKEQGLKDKGIRLLLHDDIPASGDDPSTKGTLQKMVNIVSQDLLQATFTVNTTTGNFVIVNSKDNGFQLTKDSISDLMALVYYNLGLRTDINSKA